MTLKCKISSFVENLTRDILHFTVSKGNNYRFDSFAFDYAIPYSEAIDFRQGFHHSQPFPIPSNLTCGWLLEMKIVMDIPPEINEASWSLLEM